MPLTRAQFINIKKQAEPLISSWFKKECRQLAQFLEQQLPTIEKSDPELLTKVNELIAQLKWVACDLLNDEEFYKLFREHLLEGMELENNDLARLIDNKIAMTFGIGSLGLTNNSIHAFRQNIQAIGQKNLMVKDETRPVRPVIRNWLIDFLRNTSNENPTDVDISNYLFNNQNCKTLSPDERTLLGQILNLYVGLKIVAQKFAEQEREQMLASPIQKEEELSVQPKFQEILQEHSPQAYTPQQNLTAETPQVPRQEPDQPAISAPQNSNQMAKSYTREALGSPYQTPNANPDFNRQKQNGRTLNLNNQTYREPIEEKDLAGPPAVAQTPIAPPATKKGPLTQGNVIDLRDLNK